jgi:hypothetical protein
MACNGWHRRPTPTIPHFVAVRRDGTGITKGGAFYFFFHRDVDDDVLSTEIAALTFLRPVASSGRCQRDNRVEHHFYLGVPLLFFKLRCTK